ncbi:protein arginine N-methyltransferase 5-like [Tropilaelaps mercedesae]|uniref:Protein arginine N-methyltransferase 5-like n=1 Tax=Tropilaelaps mercedesae TaxID=418985 RepID=A0A1V9X285_9ACAR|nr:protein arginine N-methyltransferase 5-like [Tropilaelaps mercedesae]
MGLGKLKAKRTDYHAISPRITLTRITRTTEPVSHGLREMSGAGERSVLLSRAESRQGQGAERKEDGAKRSAQFTNWMVRDNKEKRLQATIENCLYLTMSEKSPRLSVCIDLHGAPTLQKAVEFAYNEGFNYVCTNMTLPSTDADGVNARGPHEVPSNTIQEGVQGRVLPGLDLDDPELNDTKRKCNERLLRRELEHSTFLGVSVVQMDLTKRNANLSLVLQDALHRLEHNHNVPVIWVRVPLSGPPNDEFEPFRRWEAFRQSCPEPARIWVSLIIPEDLPDSVDEILDLWMAEQVASLTISTTLFLMNANNFPVLAKAHQLVVRRLLGLHPIVTLTDCSLNSPGEMTETTGHVLPKLYADYLNHMFARREHVGPLQEQFTFGYQDQLQIPLQPLADHLESVTYEVFEKDPVKYAKYREALLAAFEDRREMVEERQSPLIIMVVGAGRGPLVTACLECSVQADVPLVLYAVEKNPSAATVLRILNRDRWHRQVTVVDGDMRTWEPPGGERCDILVSEMLGSWADNELAPECLDGAQRLLRPDGISIPASYNSYVNPIQCPQLHRQARQLKEDILVQDGQLQTPYVVYFRHVNHLAPSQRLFSFSHPNKAFENGQHPPDNTHNERYAELSFVSKSSCMFHGFAGYFDCVLYKDIMISTEPTTHTPEMNSWFPIYIPISEPQHVKKGETITAVFWRRTSSTKVWYQWLVTSPQRSIMHNIGGRCSNIGLML